MRSASTLALVCILCSNASAQTKEETKSKKKDVAPKIEPRADELMKLMSNQLAGLPKMSFRVEAVREVVNEDGVKIQFHTTTDVAVQRPDKLRADVKREGREGTFYYDGKTFAVHGKGSNYFATAPAPATLDEAMDAAQDKYEIEAPTADFLYSDPYRNMMDGVQSGSYLGFDEVDGTRCHHLIFRSADVDWQVWIEDADKPLPRRLVITSKKMKSAPQYEANLTKWDVAPKLVAETFQFKPPDGAVQVDFMAARQSARTKDLKQAKSKGQRKE